MVLAGIEGRNGRAGMVKALALKSAIATNFRGSSTASFSRRLVCTHRIGFFIHQPCWAEGEKARQSKEGSPLAYAVTCDQLFFESAFIG
jgi:hypothetical protein